MTIDLSFADRYTDIGAAVVAEMIGIHAIMINGNPPNFTHCASDGTEGVDKVRSYHYNQSRLDNNKGSELCMAISRAFNTRRDLLHYRPGDIVSKERYHFYLNSIILVVQVTNKDLSVYDTTRRFMKPPNGNFYKPLKI